MSILYCSILLDLCSGQVIVYLLLDMINLGNNAIEKGREFMRCMGFFIFPQTELKLVFWFLAGCAWKQTQGYGSSS